MTRKRLLSVLCAAIMFVQPVWGASPDAFVVSAAEAAAGQEVMEDSLLETDEYLPDPGLPATNPMGLARCFRLQSTRLLLCLFWP